MPTSKANHLLNDIQVISTEHPFEGLPNGSECLAKVQLAYEINKIIKNRGLTQKGAAKLLDITQPEVSNLSKGKLSGFTFDRIYRCLTALEVDIEIRLKSHSSRVDVLTYLKEGDSW